MGEITYQSFALINPADFLPLLNSSVTRTHLIEHPAFDERAVREWVSGKLSVDNARGCRVRAVVVDGELAGWCGIQYESGAYELAIVLAEKHWGFGIAVFRELMAWAREFGHTNVLIHFLHTRREYRFLQKLAKAVYPTEMLGSKFTTYELAVD